MCEIPTWCAQPYRPGQDRPVRRAACRGRPSAVAQSHLLRWTVVPARATRREQMNMRAAGTRSRGGAVVGCGASKDAHEAPVSERNTTAWPGRRCGAAPLATAAVTGPHELALLASPVQQRQTDFFYV
jgi:hypothetical protein